MPIGTVVKRGNSIFVYDENARQKFVLGDGIVENYTNGSLTVRRGNSIYVYDDNGHVIKIICPLCNGHVIKIIGAGKSKN